MQEDIKINEKWPALLEENEYLQPIKEPLYPPTQARPIPMKK